MYDYVRGHLHTLRKQYGDKRCFLASDIVNCLSVSNKDRYDPRNHNNDRPDQTSKGKSSGISLIISLNGR